LPRMPTANCKVGYMNESVIDTFGSVYLLHHAKNKTSAHLGLSAVHPVLVALGNLGNSVKSYKGKDEP
ncbi:MAG: hypothetical protein ABEJ03_03095, partial [Candidatus Nanohaloarchaea archaeon]